MERSSQHASGVMQVAHHFFENGVAFFTRNLQVNISFTASSGDSESIFDYSERCDPCQGTADWTPGAPFVGHNA
jgi:hypothetical protein